MLVGFSDLHFVRCVKPNQKKAPRAFEPEMVEAQLRCSGVFEAVRSPHPPHMLPSYYPVSVPSDHPNGS